MGKYTAWKMKAAICDDTVEDAEFMEKHIKEYFMKKSIPYECNVYQSSKALWYEIEDGQAFDLLFLEEFWGQKCPCAYFTRKRTAHPNWEGNAWKRPQGTARGSQTENPVGWPEACPPGPMAT